jgi:hypothetical protein
VSLPASYPIGTRNSFHRLKSHGTWSSPRLQLVLKSKMVQLFFHCHTSAWHLAYKLLFWKLSYSGDHVQSETVPNLEDWGCDNVLCKVLGSHSSDLKPDHLLRCDAMRCLLLTCFASYVTMLAACSSTISVNFYQTSQRHSNNELFNQGYHAALSWWEISVAWCWNVN